MADDDLSDIAGNSRSLNPQSPTSCMRGTQETTALSFGE